MDPIALCVEVFGVGSLAIAFAKYTIDKRKIEQCEDNMKNQLRRF